MAILIVFENSGTYEPLRLTSRPLILGRSSKANLQLSDSMCSGQHASLQLAPDGNIILSDLNSTNGTYVNETLITTASRIFIDDVVRIGDTRFSIDKSSLSPKERQILTSNSNKTSFTKIELPGLDQDKLSQAKLARQKAMGLAKAEPAPLQKDDDDIGEISVVFDQDQIEQAIDDKELESDEPPEDSESEPEPKAKAQMPIAPPEPVQGAEVMFDMEESSGKTKMIKLNRDSLPSSKKSSKTVHKKKTVLKKDESKGFFSKVKGIFGSDD
tara:strand:+ start:5198 stop:6010 length:813 start_codon:yes stop_codon:yes gene_type:complete